MPSPPSPICTVVGIGASAGGIPALKTFFQALPEKSGLAFVVIVHLSAEHVSILDEILQSQTKMPVRQVTETIRVQPDHVYVIPPAKHLAMVDGHIRLTEPKKSDGQRLPIDLFFRTLSAAYGRKSYAVILSGAGADGTLGLQRVKEDGGFVLAQEPAEAEYPSMPDNAIATGLVDVVLPVADLPGKILSIERLEQKQPEAPADAGEEIAEEENAKAFRNILALLRVQTGHDFSTYKQPTLLRRLARRLHVNELEDIGDYLQLLREKPGEVQSLLSDLLITVTNFFRDKEAFAVLETRIIPELFQGKSSQDTVRVWSCGSATGEEAYSLSILLHEYADTLASPPAIQVFASDINEAAIRFGRDCKYSDAITSDVSPERLRRFFTRKGAQYCVNKALRDSVLFAPHNVLRDPPFSHLDLVACRNLLIYLNRETQDRTMEVFNFALRPGGYLFLGSSEAADHCPSLFLPVEKKFRIYRALKSDTRPASLLPNLGRWEIKLPGTKSAHAETPHSFSAIHHMAAEHYAPPSVLVNADYDVVHMSDRAGRFLKFAGGEPSRNLFHTVLPSLQLDLRAALVTAKQENRQTEFRNVPLDDDGSRVNVIVRPVEVPNSQARYFLVVFEDERRSVHEDGTEAVFAALKGDSALEAVVNRLEEELQQTRERLRSNIEQGETSVEELKASNEELQAINEELRSATEELETSKEELQSVNEELTTVNHELKEKIEEISDINADLHNLMHSTDIGTIFLDRHLRIKRYTRRIEDLFNIIGSDIGRPIDHVTQRVDYADLSKDAADVLRNLRTLEREVRASEGQAHFLARIAPYRTADDRIDGVVVSFVEITSLKQATDALRERDLQLRMAQQAASAGIWVLNLKDGSAVWSDDCFRIRGREPGSLEMTVQNWIHRFHPEDSQQVEEAIHRAVKERREYNFETKIRLPSGEYRWLMEVGQAVYNEDGVGDRIAGITLDVTERVKLRQELAEHAARTKQSHEALETADRRKDEFLATLAHELRNPLAPICNGLELLNTTSDPREMEKARAIIGRQVAQIVHLVDDLLDVSRITQGKIHLRKQPVHLATAIHSALEASQPLITAQRHTFDVSLPEDPIYLDADPTRLSQIILNLLNNAAKYTAPGGQIALTVEPSGRHVTLRVRDTGIGIAPDMISQVFEIFAQVNQRSGHIQSGLGIGLNIVKNLVALHGGTVHAHSDGLGHGTEFRVTLPTIDAPATPDHPAAAHSDTPRTARILVVDDNIDAGMMMQVLLTNSLHTVQVAHDGQSAVALAQDFHPEIALLDIGLPDIDGYQVARLLRAQNPRIKLVAISGWGQREDRQRSHEAGFDHHLVKPASIEQIEQIVRHCLS